MKFKVVFILAMTFILSIEDVKAFSIKSTHPRLVCLPSDNKKTIVALVREGNFFLPQSPKDLAERNSSYLKFVRLYSFLWYLEKKEIWAIL